MRWMVAQHEGTTQVYRVEGERAYALDPELVGHDLRAIAGGAATPAASGEGVVLDTLRPALAFNRLGKLLCIGLNYADHAAEGGRPVPDYPVLFTRYQSSVVAAGEALRRPRVSEKLDYEAELLVIIGQGGRYIREQDALSHVWGYSCFNDGSVRDYQRKSTHFTQGKNFDSSGAMGPVVVSAQALPPGAHGLRIACRVDGETLQEANTRDMVFSVAKAIAIISEFTTLETGDMIAMGTPSGVGFARTPPRWLRPGERVEVEIEGIGILANTVRDE